MSERLTAFSLGNAAILTNACLLPLYPGLLAFLAGNAKEKRASTIFLGVLVLAGILSMMLLIGLLLHLLQASFGNVLSFLLPIIYGVVIVMGVLMLTDNNPFTKLSTVQAPILKNTHATAYVYGLLFGPMTLPCVGPLITSAFAIGASQGTGELIDGILFFLFFGLGFGWPLAVLPVVALPAQRRLVGWLTQNHTLLNRASGILLVAVGVFGILTELLPQYIIGFELERGAWGLYWLAVAALIAAVSYLTYRATHPPETLETQQG
jgi:cytochrome c-type biogenesis protein